MTVVRNPAAVLRRGRRGFRAVALAVGLAAATTMALPLSASASPAQEGASTAIGSSVKAAAASSPWKLTWSDEFSGAAGAAVNSANWQFDTGGSGWGNNELEYYTNSTKNASLDGSGHLRIIATTSGASANQCWYGTCKYTSARLNTAGKITAQYGQLDARIKIPCGTGLWPAFWALGSNIGTVGWPTSGEIDTMENIGSEPGEVHGSLHGPSGYNTTSTYTLPNSARFCGGYHIFQAFWYPSYISFAVDGNIYATEQKSAAGAGWVFNHPFYLLLNLAVGGNFPGSPTSATKFPATMLVDYVRVYTPTGTASTITGIGKKCVDVAGAGTADGTPVDLYTCNGTSAQQWTIQADGTIRALGKCMDVVGGGVTDGTQVDLYTCNGTGAQQWIYSTATNTIVNAQSNFCLDATGKSSANGTRLQIWGCSGGTNQSWTA